MGEVLCKVAVTGPESSGKTTLCRSLSKSLSIPWIPEFARIYLTLKHQAYAYADLVYMAEIQCIMEDIYLGTAHRVVICDTSMLDILIWSKVKYGRVDEYIEKALKGRYAAFILCKPDIPWQEDPLRENQHGREDLFQIFLDCLRDYQLPFIELEGSEQDRLRIASEYITAIC